MAGLLRTPDFFGKLRQRANARSCTAGVAGRQGSANIAMGTVWPDGRNILWENAWPGQLIPLSADPTGDDHAALL